MNSVDISFITVNYNSSNHTLALIQSIIQHTSLDTNFEIIVVDNASDSEDYKHLQNFISHFPQVTLIRNRINNGFAGGNMLGVNYARGTYYFFINNDCLLLNNAGNIMKSYMDNHSNIAVATAKVTDKNGHFSSSYKQFPSVIKQWFGNSVHRWISSKSFPSNKVQLKVPTAVEIISGSCMFFKAENFCAIGGLDTVFFLYCEEEDICKRVWNYGKEVYFLPEAEIFHVEGGSSTRNLALEKEFYISYNLLLHKHFNFFTRSLMKLALLLKQFRRIFTKKHGLSLFLFVSKGAPLHKSLRYRQTLHS